MKKKWTKVKKDHKRRCSHHWNEKAPLFIFRGCSLSGFGGPRIRPKKLKNGKENSHAINDWVEKKNVYLRFVLVETNIKEIGDPTQGRRSTTQKDSAFKKRRWRRIDSWIAYRPRRIDNYQVLLALSDPPWKANKLRLEPNWIFFEGFSFSHFSQRISSKLVEKPELKNKNEAEARASIVFPDRRMTVGMVWKSGRRDPVTESKTKWQQR